MEEREKKYKRTIFAVSDATGKTCETVIMAALSQFTDTSTDLRLFPQTRSLKQIQEIFQEAVKINGVIVYTMVSPQLRQMITELSRLYAVPIVDILGPLLTRFSDLLEISPLAQPGLFRQLDDEYFNRIEAVDFAIKHDDGMGLSTLSKAEIVLLGISRTCKTPLSIYLSYRGWLVANVPVLPDTNLPPEVHAIDPKRIICLTMHPSRLEVVRQEREVRQNLPEELKYSDRERIQNEIAQALRLYKRNNWFVIDVTFKSIEESATEIMREMYTRLEIKKGNIMEPET